MNKVSIIGFGRFGAMLQALLTKGFEVDVYDKNTIDNAEVNDIINRPFTARFYINETHITCHDNEKWSETIDDYGFANVY